MKNLVPVKNESGQFSGEEHARSVYARVVEALELEEQVAMDMEGVQSLSPSFAYEAFGKLVDRFGPSVESKLTFENDPMHLSVRIIQAMERRKRVVEANAKSR